MGRKRGRTGRTAKREERDQGYPASADRVVRRAVRRLVKVERRLERARRELDESAADIETLNAQIRALRVAMMAPGVEAAPGAPAGEPVIAEATEEFAIRVEVTVAAEPAEVPVIAEESAQEPAEEPAEEPAVIEEIAVGNGAATLEESAELSEELAVPDEFVVAEEVGPPSGEVQPGPEEPAGWAETGAPVVSPEAGEALEASWPSAITGVLEPGIPAPDLETPADAGAVAQAEIEAEIEAAAVAEIETAETPGEALLAEPDPGPPAVLAGEVLEPDEVPPAGEDVPNAMNVEATPTQAIASTVSEAPPDGDVWPGTAPTGVADDSRWPLPEERPVASSDAAAELGAPSAADASAASETDAEAAISDLADQTDQAAPQRRVFRGWPFIDPERRW